MNLKSILESVLFVADQPISLSKLAEAAEASESDVKAALDELSDDYCARASGILLKQVAGGYRLFTNPDNARYVERLFRVSEVRRLSQAAMEVLSIIAYKQPVTRLEINAVRGVNSDGALSTLLARDLVRAVGRQNAPGNPILYGTTKQFLEAFGLRGISDLPPLQEFEPDGETKERIQRTLRADSEPMSAERKLEGAANPTDNGEDAIGSAAEEEAGGQGDPLAPAKAIEELLADGWLDK